MQPGLCAVGACAGSREAWVHCLKGEVRFTPGDGEAEVRPDDMRFYDGATAIAPQNTGSEYAAFLVTLVRKKHA